MNERIAKYTGWIAEQTAKYGQSIPAAGEVYALGIIRSYADPGTGTAMSDAERLAGIRDALAALDQATGGAR